jgi:hypothetical protein
MSPDKFSLSFFRGEAVLHNLELRDDFLQARRSPSIIGNAEC